MMCKLLRQVLLRMVCVFNPCPEHIFVVQAKVIKCGVADNVALLTGN